MCFFLLGIKLNKLNLCACDSWEEGVMISLGFTVTEFHSDE